MSSSDRILFLNGSDNFSITGEKVGEIPVRNRITVTNTVALEKGYYSVGPSNFRLESKTDYQDLYVEFTTSSRLNFKIPSKNMLIRVEQRRLNLTKKIIFNLMISHGSVNLDRGGGYNAGTAVLYQSEFIEYKNTNDIITCLHCIPEHYYSNGIVGINISADNAMTIPAGYLTLEFFQF